MGTASLTDDRKFDLFAQPFWVLGIDPTTTVDGIEAVLSNNGQSSPAADITRAIETLFDPDRRLLCELSYPLECAGPEIAELYAALSAGGATDDLLEFSNRLWPLARANFLTHIASHRPASGQLLYEIVRSHAAIDSADIGTKVRTARTQAGFSAPSFVHINQALVEIRRIHCEAILAGYEAVEDAAQPLLDCILKVFASDELGCSKALAKFLRTYRQATEQSRSAACARVQSASERILREPGSRTAMIEMRDAATAWLLVARPLLLWNAEQPQRRLTFDTPIVSLRRLLGKLCEKKQYPVAAEIATGTREIFSAVPTTLGELTEDARLLAILSSHSSITQLKSELQLAEKEPGQLIAALETGGFGASCTDPADRLWRTFADAARSSSASDLSPWELMHEFVLHLSNHPAAGAAVVALIEGLIRFCESTAAPPSMLTKLRANLHFMQAFMGDEPGTKNDAAKATLARKASKVGTFSNAISDILRGGPIVRLFGRNSFWGKPLLGISMAAVLALCIPAFYFGFGRLPLLSAATGESVASLGAETIPQVGTGQRLSLTGVRYCHFQQERLRLVKQMIKRPEDARLFNLLIVDYNSRCSDFFYKDEDRRQVEAEVTVNKDILQADARRIVASWSASDAEATANN
jgi:hypothetical protein